MKFRKARAIARAFFMHSHYILSVKACKYWVGTIIFFILIPSAGLICCRFYQSTTSPRNNRF